LDNNLIIATFNDNISYLEKYQPKVFSKLLALESAIENGYYQEKYELVFDNNQFDVVEKSSLNSLYSGKSEAYVNLASKSINYELQENLFRTTREFTFSDKDIKRYQSLPFLEDEMSGLAPILSFIQMNTQGSECLGNINKFIFFGTGLGLHIEKIHEQIHSKVYLIIEDDLELFRLSLFATNYKKLAETTTFVFSVFEDDSEFLQTSTKFLNIHYEENQYLKYFEMLNHNVNKRNLFHLAVTTQPHLAFSYNSYLKQSLFPLEYIFNEYQFINKSISFLNNKLNKKPVLLLAAGPSLGKNLEWLKENVNDFIIVAVSATLSLLEREEVKPDIVIHLDAFNASVEHFKKLKSIEFLKETVFFFSAKTLPEITLLFDKKQIFFFENGTEYKENSFRPSAPCVGSISYQILLYLKVKTIYLLGLDLAVDNKTGQTHSDAHSYVKTVDLSKNAYESSEMTYKDHLIEVEGNLLEKVFTTPHFKTSIDSIDYFTSVFQDDTRQVINLSEGAKFTQTMSMQIQEYSSSRKYDVNVSKELYKLLLKNISKKLSNKENNVLRESIESAKNIRELITKYQSEKIESVGEYKDSILSLSNRLCNEKSAFNQALDIYFKTILPYIFHYLNQKKIEFSKNELLSLRNLFGNELGKIANYYLSKIQLKFEDKQSIVIEHKFLKSFQEGHEKIKDKEKLLKSNIGFLASQDNINDNDLTGYIQELCNIFPEMTFRVFYFSDLQKDEIEKKLDFEDSRLEFTLLQDINDIGKMTDIVICNDKIQLDKNIHDTLRRNSSAISMNYNTVGKDYSIMDIIDLHKSSNHPLQIDPEYFGFTKDIVEEKGYSVHKILYEKYLDNLSDDTNVYDLMYFQIINQLLSDKSFRDFYMQYLHNEISYIDEHK